MFYEKEQHLTYQIYSLSWATNGWAERLVRPFKNTFRKMEGPGSLKENLNMFLFMYRFTA